MPGIAKRQGPIRSAILQRWPKENILSKKEGFSRDDGEIDVDFEGNSEDEGDFLEKTGLNDIGDLLELCQQQGNLKSISLLLYMILKYFGISWQNIDDFLQQIGGNRCATAYKWAKYYLTGDLVEFNNDNRGGKLSQSFYDIFPDIEHEAKLFATNERQKKTSNFKAADLRHETDDVVDRRNIFINYFLSHTNHYHTLIDDEAPAWITPIRRPCILICHGESTFRSGEVSAERWIMNDSNGCFSKGRGRTHMLSDFLVQYPSGPFFSLNNNEWHEAIKKYPTLNLITDVDYVERSVTASINIGSDFYSDNNTILDQ